MCQAHPLLKLIYKININKHTVNCLLKMQHLLWSLMYNHRGGGSISAPICIQQISHRKMHQVLFILENLYF